MQKALELFSVERDEGVEVALAHQRLGGGHQRQYAHDTGEEAPEVEKPDQNQQQHAAELGGVAHLVAVLGCSFLSRAAPVAAFLAGEDRFPTAVD